MGTNFHTAWEDGVTMFKASMMTSPLAALDKGITYLKNVIVHCDGEISYNKSTGVLAWLDVLRIFFIREDGQAIQNTVAAGNITLADNEFAYVDLNETNDTVITISKAAITTGTASNFIAVNRLVLAYRNTTSDDIYPVYLQLKQLHNITSTSHHTSTATNNRILKANSNGLPIDATNTDAEISDAVTKKHIQGTDQGLDTGGANAVTVADIKDTVVFTNKRYLRHLASGEINAQTLTKQTIYTPLSGEAMIPNHIVIRKLSASLAGLIDMDIGGNALADDWLQEISLDSFSGGKEYGKITQPDQVSGPPIVPTKKTAYLEADPFGVKINTGSTGAATFVVDLFGHVYPY